MNIYSSLRSIVSCIYLLENHVQARKLNIFVKFWETSLALLNAIRRLVSQSLEMTQNLGNFLMINRSNLTSCVLTKIRLFSKSTNKT